MSLTVIDWGALALVVIVGLPHGAFDAAISLSMITSAQKIKQLIGILTSYLLLAIFVILVWYQFPEFSLFMFLIISVVHFGLADYSANPAQIKWAYVIGHGGVVALWLPVIHKEEVTKLFAILTNGPTPFLWQIMASLVLIWMVGTIVHLYQTLRSKQHYPAGFELIGLIVLAWIAPPLVTFAIYFCFIHSRRHFAFVWKQLQSISTKRMLINSAFLLSVASWLMGGTLYWYLHLQMTVSDAALQTIFIGLAALTVPHMILIDLIFRPYAVKTFEKN